MTKRYVKSDIVDRPYFTKGRAYEVLFSEGVGFFVKDDEAYAEWLVADNSFGHTCPQLYNKGTWKWCDENGREL